MHNVGGWTSHWAKVSPTALAVVDGERRLAYAEFEERIARTAGALAARGVERGERVALLLANRSSYLEIVLACARLGAIAVPMNTRLRSREVAFQLDDARPRVVIAERELADLVDDALGHAAHVPSSRLEASDEPGGDDLDRARADASPREAVAVAPDDPMIILYTSGTTGSPKGALLPHRKTLFNALNAQLYFHMRAGAERVLVPVPLFHSLGLTILSLPTLYSGGALVLERGFDAARAWGSVAREGITFFGGVPTQYARLLEALDAGASPASARASLRFLFTAGAAIRAETVRAYQRHGIVLKQGYGQTETSILCCLDERDAVRKAGTVGRPVMHAELRVVEPASLAGAASSWRDAELGATGEIVVRGPIAMLGYWEREKESAETLRDGWLRTGDLARVDEEGFVTLVGRAREMYISGGENVYPAEVEAALAAHPAVAEVAVVGLPDETWGESGCAFVVLAPGATLELGELLEFADDRLARFKHPRRLVLVPELPRTASGKVRKHELATELANAR